MGIRQRSAYHRRLLRSRDVQPRRKTAGNRGNDSIKLLDLSRGNALRTLPARMSFGRDPSFRFSPDGRLLAYASVLDGKGDSTIRLWDVASGSQLRTFDVDASAVAFGP